MGSRGRWWVCLASLWSVCVFGCGEEKSIQPPSTGDNTSQIVQQTEVQSPAADVAVRELLASFRNDPHLLWEALPSGFQRAIERQQADFFSRVDPQSFNKLLELIGRLRAVLQNHRELILGEQNEYLVPGIGLVSAKQYDYFLGVLESVSPPAIENFDSAREGTVLKLWSPLLVSVLAEVPNLEHAEQPLLVQYAQRMERVQVTLKIQSENEAVLQLLDPDASDVLTEFTFVLKQGKWIPQTWDQQWPIWMATTKLQLDNIAAAMSSSEQTGSKLLSLFEQKIVELEQAEGEEQFQTAWEEALAPLSAWGIRLLPNAKTIQPQREPLEAINLNSSVKIVLSRHLTADELEQISEQVLRLSEYPEVAVLLPVESEGEQTVFRLAPAPNIQTIAGQIRFGEVQAIDEAGRRIVVDIPKAK